jgi:hypothetical protein
MEKIVIPELDCPISPAINENVEIAHNHNIQWACDFKLIPDNGEKYERFCAAKFAWLFARSYPDVSIDELNLLCDLFTWYFVVDDLLDEYAPKEVDIFGKGVMDILKSSITVQNHPLFYGLYDIQPRMLAKIPAFWRHRFVCHLQQWFQAVRWEAVNRIKNTIPDLAIFTKMRLFAGGMYLGFDMINAFSQKYRSHHGFLEHIYVQQLEMMANNYICWTNGILGCHRDLKNGEVQNVVIVLQKEYSCSLQEACNRAVDMCNAEISAFFSLKSQLPSIGETENHSLKHYINGLQIWMRAYLDWGTKDTKRYQVEE